MVKSITSSAAFDEALKATPIVVVDFFATWCPPCRIMAPLFEDWESQLIAAGDGAHISFAKVDVDRVPDLAARLGVTAMPTFLVYQNGELIRKIVGANPPALQRAVEERLSSVQPEPTAVATN